ncbi:M48 family metallopeptidase [Rhizobium sp. TRM95796]|uniref:M48 family metallopeptidase n=1 Tax=Rhizobium sp. TRM95796 TaxID=2979862 RepID=UPI0021E98C7F|nr:M48 family metallopeptidase [Rhizobium sp. TRM95796]MCV3767023.1 M48 family metallopeptidase [Rhizobium sp. TRM95796]
MASDVVRLSGHWHPPGANLATPAELNGGTDRLEVKTDDGAVQAVAPLGDVRVSDRIGSVPRRFAFINGGLFETPDNEGVDVFLRAARADRSGWIHGLERSRPRLAFFALAIILLAFGIYRYGLPALVEVAVRVTPPVVNDLLAEGALQSLDRTLLSQSALSEDRQDEILEEFYELAANGDRGVGGYNLEFRDGGYIGPNAFALPNGVIVLTDQLVELARGDNDMILGVLAHEIGHVDHKHSLRQVYRVAGTAALITLIAGDIGSASEDMLTNGAALLTLSNSRAAEEEADRTSVELMKKAGRDPAAIGRFFAILEANFGDSEGPNMLSTHPATPERRKAVEAYARELNSKK